MVDEWKKEGNYLVRKPEIEEPVLAAGLRLADEFTFQQVRQAGLTERDSPYSKVARYLVSPTDQIRDITGYPDNGLSRLDTIPIGEQEPAQSVIVDKQPDKTKVWVPKGPSLLPWLIEQIKAQRKGKDNEGEIKKTALIFELDSQGCLRLISEPPKNSR